MRVAPDIPKKRLRPHEQCVPFARVSRGGGWLRGKKVSLALGFGDALSIYCPSIGQNLLSSCFGSGPLIEQSAVQLRWKEQAFVSNDSGAVNAV